MTGQSDNPLQALSEIALTINSIQDIGPLLRKVLEIAMQTLQAERGFVLLKTGKTDNGFEVKSSSNFNEDQVADLTEISTSVVHEVLKTAEPVILYETETDPRYQHAKSIVLQKIQSIACAPLILKNQQIGAIYLDSLTHRSRFTEESLPFLTAFANQAAIAIENARLYASLRNENRLLRSEVQRLHGFQEIIGQSPRMQEVFNVMTQVLDSDATVLIEGESGSGKELIARAIHYQGTRRERPFLALFCGSLPDSLLESELFGHKRGAFTGAISDKKGLFESADGGTFFLDEVGDLSLKIQTKLLRVLQEGEVRRVGENHVRQIDVRIISATNKKLTDLIEEGLFREDLYYRLNTIRIETPPLRSRKIDIPLLAHHFLDKYTAKRKHEIKGFTEEAIDALQKHQWPGNVRELGNCIERSVVMARGDLIQLQDLGLQLKTRNNLLKAGITLAEAQQQLVEQTLRDLNGNVPEAAKALDVSQRWLYYKIKEWQL